MLSISTFRKTHKVIYPWIIIFLCALFLVYKYILQVFPSVITHDLRAQFHLDGVSFGNIGAMFFYAYVIVQLFAGALLDKLGARFLSALAILVCAFGAIGFSKTDSLWGIYFSRIAMGAGVAFATIGYLKLGAAWFNEKRFALVSGLLATAAMTGSMVGQLPFERMVHFWGWHQAVFYLGVAGIIFAVVFYLVVRSDPQHMQVEHHTPIEVRNIHFDDMLAILTMPRNWLLMIYAGFAFSPINVFGGLWGDPFLERVYSISQADAAGLTSLSFLGLAIGAPIIGFISDKIGNRIDLMIAGIIISFVSLLGALYSPIHSLTFVGACMFLFGIGMGSYLLVFPLGKEVNSLAITATVFAFVNTSDPLIGSFTEPLLGGILDHFSHGKMHNGIAYFSAHDYHLSFILLPIYLMIALVFLFILKRVLARTR